jgi:phosphoglycerol transferase MdoB-like AlkP superfamily enzyme
VKTHVAHRLTAAEGRRFGLTVGAAFLVLAGVALWRGKGTASTIFATLATLLILAGIAIPTRLGPVQRGWMGIAHAISKVTTPIFLAVIYFVVIAPAGFVLRLFGRKPLQPPRDATTYWVSREQKSREADAMAHQY